MPLPKLLCAKFGQVLPISNWDGLNIFIDIQTSKTLIQMDINKMMSMEFIQWRVNTYSQKAKKMKITR